MPRPIRLKHYKRHVSSLVNVSSKFRKRMFRRFIYAIFENYFYATSHQLVGLLARKPILLSSAIFPMTPKQNFGRLPFLTTIYLFLAFIRARLRDVSECSGFLALWGYWGEYLKAVAVLCALFKLFPKLRGSLREPGAEDTGGRNKRMFRAGGRVGGGGGCEGVEREQ